MAKAEISWKRRTEDGQRLEVYAHHVGDRWIFYSRERRIGDYAVVEHPPLQDWLELLDSLVRLVNRRRYQPSDEELLRRQIRERFPEAGV